MTRALVVLHVVVDVRPGSRVWGTGGHGGGSHLLSARVVADKQKQRLAAGRWGGAHGPELQLHLYVHRVTGFQKAFTNPLPRGHCVCARACVRAGVVLVREGVCAVRERRDTPSAAAPPPGGAAVGSFRFLPLGSAICVVHPEGNERNQKKSKKKRCARVGCGPIPPPNPS